MGKYIPNVGIEHNSAMGIKKRGWARPLWFGPAILLGSFILVFALFLWILRENSYKSQMKELVANAELASEGIRLRLDGNRDYLLMIAKDRGDGLMDVRTFQERASRYVADHPEMINITWVDASFHVHDVAPLAPNRQIVGLRLDLPEPKRASRLAMERRQPVYTHPFEAIQGKPSFEIWVPVFHADVFLGLFAGVYSCEKVVQHLNPPQVLKNSHVSLVDASGKVLWEFPVPGTVDETLVHQVFLTPQESGVSLRFKGYGRGAQAWSLLLLEFLCMALVLAMAYAMWGLKHEIEVRKQTEESLHLQAVELEEEVAERQVAQENIREKALLLEEEIEKRQEAQEELERLNEGLELRVQERTSEVVAKSDELELKNRELERFNKLFVGRELKMVELKERIKELENVPEKRGDQNDRQ